MKILHINSYFIAAPLYKNLYDKELELKQDIDVYVPVNKKTSINHERLGEYSRASKVFSTFDRVFFYRKHKKILSDIKETYDLKEYDIVIGYRADDSYFSFAESFVQNGLPLRSLNQALRLGKLGEQTVLISEKAFSNLSFEGYEPADKTIYYPKFITRDSDARETYKREIHNSRSYKDDIFILDILREEMKSDDLRIQRIISE